MFIRMLCTAVLMLYALSPSFATPQCPPGVHPIIEATNGNLFGGCIDGRWVGDTTIARKMNANLSFRLYSPTSVLGEVKGHLTWCADVEGNENQVPMVELATLPKTAKESEKTIIGINGTWNALPRQSKEEDPQQAIYESVVKVYLNTKGLLLRPAQISRIVRVDLEGDGVDEVLIDASSIKDANSWPEKLDGYFSVVLLRKLMNGTVKTIPVATNFYQKDNGEGIFYSLESLLDVNGDGNMEIVLGSYFSEVGQGLSIYQITGSKAKEVLFEGGGE